MNFDKYYVVGIVIGIAIGIAIPYLFVSLWFSPWYPPVPLNQDPHIIHGICTRTQQDHFTDKMGHCNAWAWDNFPDEYCYAFDACMVGHTYYSGCGSRCL